MRLLLRHPFLQSMLIVAISFFISHKLLDQQVVADITNNEIGFSFLLGIGLYGAVYGIQLEHLRNDLRDLGLAISAGVMIKVGIIYALTSIGMLFINGLDEVLIILVLAASLAQIDPLSVSRILADEDHISVRARTFISAWASLDDPVTVLLVTTMLAFFGVADYSGGQISAYAALYIVLIGLVPWLALSPRVSRLELAPILRAALFIPIFALSVYLEMFAIIAIMGMVYRPIGDNLVGKLVVVAYILALGIVGINLEVQSLQDLALPALLGGAVFVSQFVVGQFFARNFEARDRTRIALAQQNGITAIMLGLILVPVLDDVISVIAVAICIINILHFVANSWVDRLEEARRAE